MARIANARSAIKKESRKLQGVKFIGPVIGGYTLASRRNLGPDEVKVFACRTKSMTPRRIVVDAPVRGSVGEAVVIKLDQFDIITGAIDMLTESGFAIRIEATDEERARLAAKIAWVKKHQLSILKDMRDHKRMMPPSSRAAITLGDGSVVECLVMNVSQSGAAVSADIKPKVGARLAIGKVPGIVTRFVENGFVVQFSKPLDDCQMDSVFEWSLNYLDEDKQKELQSPRLAKGAA